MNILVINSGSSSLKVDGIDSATGKRWFVGRAERLNTPGATVKVDDSPLETVVDADHGEALRKFWSVLSHQKIDAVGHRIAHGGSRFPRPVRIDDTVVHTIADLAPLAPLHTPFHLKGISIARELLPDIPHVAVFDTSFHTTLPRRAYTYALPADLAEQHGIRRYGFHGTSHGWVAARAAEFMRTDIRDLRLITCHLGSGASVCAIENGRSVDTSMGMTPLEGLVMGTRPGDLDAGVLLHLQRNAGLDVDGIEALLNKSSGLAGLSGTGADMRDIEGKAAAGDERARLAIHAFTHRLRKYVGAYAAVMGGVEAIVFTAGIGENSALIRHRAAQRLEFLGARLDEDRNRDAKVDADHPVVEISEPGSRVRLLVVYSDEQRAIAQETSMIVGKSDVVEGALQIPIAISARHIHLNRAAVDVLFGAGHQLTPVFDLSQPGQFACAEKLTVVGPKNSIEGVRVLGPERPACQVEVSRTDEFFLGVDAPVRDSGDVKNSPGITLVGPAGSLTITEGLICARRHIHMHPDDARRFGVKDRDVVEIAIESPDRHLIFGDVLIRVNEKFRLEMHVDTDEANAAELAKGAKGVLDSTGVAAKLLRRKTSFDELA